MKQLRYFTSSVFSGIDYSASKGVRIRKHDRQRTAVSLQVHLCIIVLGVQYLLVPTMGRCHSNRNATRKGYISSIVSPDD